MVPEPNLVSAIRRQGGRLTRQRKLVLEVLEAGQEHLDAETVYARAKKRDARIGLATIYRTLAFLKNAGLVAEYRFGEDHGHFEAVQTGQQHYHFTCLQCGQVSEFQSPQAQTLTRRLCEEQGVLVTTINLHLSGYCKKCRAADPTGG